eukprot:1159717-Pelagomonas_calceolata.AAC.2
MLDWVNQTEYEWHCSRCKRIAHGPPWLQHVGLSSGRAAQHSSHNYRYHYGKNVTVALAESAYTAALELLQADGIGGTEAAVLHSNRAGARLMVGAAG